MLSDLKNKKNKRKNVRRRILLRLLIVFILFFLLFIAFFYFIQDKNLKKEIVEKTEIVEKIFEEELEDQIEKLSMSLNLLARNKELISALKSGDRDMLALQAIPLYEDMYNNYGITYLYLHNTKRNNLFRAHNPSRYGDKIERFTLLEAEREKQLNAGLELDFSGVFVLRAVIPLYDGELFLGYAELGEKIDHLTKHLGNTFNFEYYILIDKKYLKKKDWIEGMERLERPASWDLLPLSVISSQSTPLLPMNILLNSMEQDPKKYRYEYLKTYIKEKHFTAMLIPLTDSRSRTVGSLVFLRDVTSEMMSAKVNFFILCFSFIIAGLFIVNFVYLVLGRAEVDIIKSDQKLLKEGRKREKLQVQHIKELEQQQAVLRETKEKEEALRTQLTNVLDITPSIIYRLKVEGKAIVPSFVSSNFMKLWGYEANEYIGNPDWWLSHLHPEDRHSTLKAFTNAFSKAKTFGHEYRFQHKEGQYRWIHDEINLLRDENGKLVEVVGSWMDVTKCKILELETRRAGHLASIGELAAGVAHEINNPINGIINLGQLLLDKKDKDEDQNKMYSLIIREGQRIATIVSGLLSFARNNKGEMGGPVNVNEVITDCLALSRTQMEKEHIILKMDISSELPAVLFNYQQLQQVFLNIFNNARQALNEKYPKRDINKIFEISAKKFPINNIPSLRIILYDHGSGISAHVRDKILEPFFSTKTEKNGTGLGLSISHGIINDYGGSLDFDSVDGKYTKVLIDLPVYEMDKESDKGEVG